MIPAINDSILLVLQHRYAGKSWCYNGEGIDGLRWTDETPKPTESQLLAQLDAVMEEIQAANESRQMAKASALSKLAALGLTEAEVSALLGA